MQNRWRLGPVNFSIPPLWQFFGPEDGLLPIPMTLDPDIGTEVVLTIRDQTPFMDQLCKLNPFQLNLKAGVARTSFGPLPFALFWVGDPARPGRPFCSWECHLNPHLPELMHIFQQLAAQTHWHCLLVDAANEQRNFFEFANTFQLHECLTMVQQICASLPINDYAQARQELTERYTLDELFEL